MATALPHSGLSTYGGAHADLLPVLDTLGGAILAAPYLLFRHFRRAAA